MKVRDGTDADGGEVAAILRHMLGEYAGCDALDRALREEMRAPGTTFAALNGGFWVAEDDAAGGLAGCAAIAATDRPDTFELRHLYVLPAQRGTGVAMRLLALAVLHARRHGARRIELWADTRFLSGQRFWERHGFVRIPGTRPAGTGEECRYALTLDCACPPGVALSPSRSSQNPTARAEPMRFRASRGRRRSRAPAR